LWSPAKGSQFDDWDTFDGLLLSRLVLHTTTRLARSKSQTEIPHRRKGHEQQRWPTAGSNPCSGLFRGWYGAEVASLSSMKIVLANETEKFGDHCRLVKIEQAEDTFETSGCAEQDPKNFRSMGHRHHTMQIPQYTGKPHVNQPLSLSEGACCSGEVEDGDTRTMFWGKFMSFCRLWHLVTCRTSVSCQHQK
jgi:hypothetical protein